MKKKKIILIIILSVITIVLSGLLVYRNMNNEEKEVIVQSNDRDETKKQFKVTNDYINIRTEADTKTAILGKVYKGEIYTILDEVEDEYYFWYLIETNNGIKGYVAVKYNGENYIELLKVKEEEKTE